MNLYSEPGCQLFVASCPILAIVLTILIRNPTLTQGFDALDVEVYIATNEPDDLGHGEGKTFLGRVTADSTGKWSLSLSTGQVTAGQRVTATAATTSTPLETSEFAENVVVTS